MKTFMHVMLRHWPSTMLFLFTLASTAWLFSWWGALIVLPISLAFLELTFGNDRLDERLALAPCRPGSQGEKWTWREGTWREKIISALIMNWQEARWKNSLPSESATHELIEDILSIPADDPEENTQAFLESFGRSVLQGLQQFGRAQVYAFRADCLRGSFQHNATHSGPNVLCCLPDEKSDRMLRALEFVVNTQEEQGGNSASPFPMDCCGKTLVSAVSSSSYFECAGNLWRIVLWQAYSSPPSDIDEKWLCRFAKQLTQSLFLRFRVRYLEKAHFEEAELRKQIVRSEEHRIHDLRSPLANIRSILEYLQLGFSDERAAPFDLRALCEAAKKDCQNISELLQGAALAKSEIVVAEQRVEEFFGECSPATLANEHCSSYRILAHEKGLTFQIDASVRAESCRLRIPEREFLSVLHNMLSNAVKYTQDGWIRLALDLSAEGFECICRDSGPGISREMLMKIRSGLQGKAEKNVRHINDRSWGEGLAQLQEKALHFGGEFSISSIEDVGTELRFVFPHELVIRSGIDSDEIEKTASRKLEVQVVLVDDESSFAYSFARLLEIAGHKTQVCTQLSQLQTLLMSQEKFPAVLLDQSLLQGSGFATCSRIRELCPSVSIAVMSGNDFFWKRNQERFAALGIHEFFLKPCGAQEVIAWVKREARSYEDRDLVGMG